MKKHGGSKTNVMLALLAVLLISLGYLSSQGIREGMTVASVESCKAERKKYVEKTGILPAHCE